LRWQKELLEIVVTKNEQDGERTRRLRKMDAVREKLAESLYGLLVFWVGYRFSSGFAGDVP
jgi:hypothetical protein